MNIIIISVILCFLCIDVHVSFFINIIMIQVPRNKIYDIKNVTFSLDVLKDYIKYGHEMAP